MLQTKEYANNMIIFENENITENKIDNNVLRENKLSLNEKIIKEDTDTNKKANWKIIYGSRQDLKSIYKKRIYDLIEKSEIEWGYLSDFEEYLIANKKKNKIILLINEIFIENLANTDVIVKIFHAFSKLSYEDTFPYAQTMCIAAMAIKDSQIQESAIELFEAWRNKEALDLLKKIDIRDNWLKKYADKVINEIEEEIKNVQIC